MQSKFLKKYFSVSVIVILIFRLILTVVVPLLDKTEARYAEISRIMLETKEWVVLQIDYNFPFWAKPPLSTWLSAISYIIFGVSEFAARFPSYLLAIFLILLASKFIKKTSISFYLLAFVLLTTPEFLIHAGVVSTDSALNFSVVLIMLSFYKSYTEQKITFWNYLFFIGIGLGLLAKGPLILVLTVPPAFIWLLVHKIKIKDIFTKLPWLTGLLTSTLISIPWYYLAEKKSPGFLDYFIVGEHFKRFLVPGWKGDLYGGPKSEPLGMIWIFLILFAFPWIQLVFYKIWKHRNTILGNKWVSFLVLWLLWTPFFFTFARNIMHTYTLPVMIPIALLVVYWWEDLTTKKTWLILGSIFPIITIISFLGILAFKNEAINKANSDKYLIKHHTGTTNLNTTPIYYWKEKSYSGQFYTNGKAQLIDSDQKLDSIFANHAHFYLISRKENLNTIPQKYMEQLKILESNYKSSIYNK